MKKVFFLLLASVMITSTFAQSEKYIKAMEAKISMLDSAKTPEVFKELANTFERIAEAEKTQWLPYYYAAFCNVQAGTFSLPMDGTFGDNSAITDPYADKAEKLLAKAEEIGKPNTETYCVQKMIASLRMMGNAMARYMTEGPKAEAALAKAKEENPNNPRVYILAAQDKYYTPEQFGGSKDEAKVLFEKAKSLFEVSKPENSIVPNWGRAQVEYFLSQYK
jgi:tetratricopeptide (TPR) repeat protein